MAIYKDRYKKHFEYLQQDEIAKIQAITSLITDDDVAASTPTRASEEVSLADPSAASPVRPPRSRAALAPSPASEEVRPDDPSAASPQKKPRALQERISICSSSSSSSWGNIALPERPAVSLRKRPTFGQRRMAKAKIKAKKRCRRSPKTKAKKRCRRSPKTPTSKLKLPEDAQGSPKTPTSKLKLPAGWRTETRLRQSGATVGRKDHYFYNKEGTEFRSMAEVREYLKKQSEGA